MSKIIIGREYPTALIPAIEKAQNSIDILSFVWYWYPDQAGYSIQKFNNALINAARRGVKVRCIINNDVVVGVLRANGITAKRVNSTKTLHAKIVIVDEDVLFVGSHNLSKNAFEINHEISVQISDKEEIARCKKFFNDLCLL